jgi:hypothetical protein
MASQNDQCKKHYRAAELHISSPLVRFEMAVAIQAADSSRMYCFRAALIRLPSRRLAFISLHLVASAAPIQKSLGFASSDHDEATRRTEQVSKDDEVKSPCRRLTVLRHTIKGRRGDACRGKR